MAYITPAELRPGTAVWPDLVLDERDVAFVTADTDTDNLLTTAIADWSEEIDRVTGDHFEPVTGDDRPDLLVPGTGAFLLPIPRRIISVSSIDQIDREGTVTALTTAQYRLRAFAVERLDGWVWYLRHTFRLNDLSYGWATTPPAIRRAVALLVWDQMKAQGGGRHLARRWVAGETEFVADLDPNSPFGIPEVDRVVRRYRVRPHIRAV